MASDRRNPYRAFDPALIQDFLKGRTILSAELLADGKSNTNYKLSLNDGQPYLLRLRSRGDAGREAHVMDLVRHFVPVPHEIYRDESWSVFTFLEGDLLQKVPEHSDKAAEALASISSVKFESSGWIDEDGTVSPFEFGGVKGYLAMVLNNPRVQTWLGDQSVEAIRVILQRESGRLDELSRESCLVHGDFNPTNILVHNEEVSGVLDWEYAHSGTPYMDIGNLLRHTSPAYHQQVQRGLAAGGMQLPGDWKERAELVDLCSHLEFLTSTRSHDFKRKCVGRVQDFICKFRGGTS